MLPRSRFGSNEPTADPTVAHRRRTGVAPADRAWLGAAYARLDPLRAGGSGGAELGLAIVRALAEAMGGTVASGPTRQPTTRRGRLAHRRTES
ncbi:hypothetical protein GR702_03100 [Novosphingobium sp. FGD1]|uniref:Histidine kinase/HSP90-like ATPase domain-containing protein n=1 Tax=Novosphingobium silvae TaxID=2692619 RepID=A0A7X4K646_9SPHN|nr:hypothetical protein [Novosphingobium silvae]MYL96760.1 hypothetical protein [Novosphingobium silvae]